MKKNNTMLSLQMLVRRNIENYLKDKMMVFFSVLAPVIVLLIYVLFLGDLQVESIASYVSQNGLSEYVSDAQISAIINNWMIAGVMAVSCLTVAVNANMSMVRDRSNGSVNDILVSPVKRWVVYASYIISCFLITFCICFVILIVAFVYLACSGGFMLGFGDVLALFGITILSCISSSFFIVLLCGFIKSVGTMSAFNGIYGTVIGFLTGAYLPFSMMPSAMKYVACFVPGTYSAGLFKTYFMKGIIGEISASLPAGSTFIDDLLRDYSIELEFFGQKISSAWMVVALLISIVLFGALILILYSSKRTNIFREKVKKKKNGFFRNKEKSSVSSAKEVEVAQSLDSSPSKKASDNGKNQNF